MNITDTILFKSLVGAIIIFAPTIAIMLLKKAGKKSEGVCQDLEGVSIFSGPKKEADGVVSALAEVGICAWEEHIDEQIHIFVDEAQAEQIPDLLKLPTLSDANKGKRQSMGCCGG